jgi:ferrous iron transport protein B
MARVCFITDKLLRKIGLGGKAIIPFILSSGCTVSGLMATRTIEDDRERRLSIFLCPFMPCGAKMVVFAYFSWAFFSGNPFVPVSLYFLSIAVAIVCGFILNLKNKNKEQKPFLLEMPSLSVPRLKDVLLVMKEKVKEFLLKAGTVIFAVSLILWVLMNFGINGYNDGKLEQSFLYYIGNGIRYIFIPLGFGSWQASVSVLSGFLAKEAVIETLSLITSSPTLIFENAFSVYSFMAFILLSVPCVATISQAKTELSSKKDLAKLIGLELMVSYLVSLIINLIGKCFLQFNNLIIVVILGIIIIAFIFSLKIIFKRKCISCAKCNRCNCENKIRLYERSRNL